MWFYWLYQVQSRSLEKYNLALVIVLFLPKIEAACINSQCLDSATLTAFSLMCFLMLTDLRCSLCEPFNFSKCLSSTTLLWIKRWGR